MRFRKETENDSNERLVPKLALRSFYSLWAEEGLLIDQTNHVFSPHSITFNSVFQLTIC